MPFTYGVSWCQRATYLFASSRRTSCESFNLRQFVSSTIFGVLIALRLTNSAQTNTRLIPFDRGKVVAAMLQHSCRLHHAGMAGAVRRWAMNRMLVTSRATRRRRPAFNDRDEDNSGADFRSRINPFGSQDQERVPVGRFSPSDADWEALDDVPSPAAGRGRDRDWRSDNRDGEGSSRSRRADGPREQRWGPKGKGSRDGRDWSRGRRDERDWRSRGSPWARNERGGEGLGNPRDNLEGECLYGVSPVVAALEQGRRTVHQVFIQKGLGEGAGKAQAKDRGLAQRVRRLAADVGVTVEEVDKHHLNLLSGNRPHQGVAADVGPLEVAQLTQAPAVVEDRRPPVWLALDEVTDPQNLGGILRSAYFLGVDGVALCARNSAPLSPTVSKASAGALEVMELHEVNSLPRFLTMCQEAGWDVYGADAGPESVDVREVAVRGPCILVMGSEGFGLRPLVRQNCTALVRVAGVEERPESGAFAVDSLNVSVATGVILHSLLGTRGE